LILNRGENSRIAAFDPEQGREFYPRKRSKGAKRNEEFLQPLRLRGSEEQPRERFPDLGKIQLESSEH